MLENLFVGNMTISMYVGAGPGMCVCVCAVADGRTGQRHEVRHKSSCQRTWATRHPSDRIGWIDRSSATRRDLKSQA